MADIDFESDEEWLDDVNMQEVTTDEVPGVKYVQPRGRMTAYAFFVQILREKYKKRHPDALINFAEFSKKCSEKWSRMSKTEKRSFQELADKDKLRYETEMQYCQTWPLGSRNCLMGNDERRAKKRKEKGTAAPKKPLSVFFLFANAERSKVKEENPNYTAGEIAQELGRRWSGADPSVRIKYQHLANNERARYFREVSEHELQGECIPAKKARQEEDEEDYVQ